MPPWGIVEVPPMRAGGVPGGDWSISDVPERQCSARKRDGTRCKNAAIQGGTVCGYHGGNAPAVKAKARSRLEMASDRLARQLPNMTTDPNVADPVKLAAIKDALDRSGLAAKNAVSVEVGITKPWEAVFEGISQIIAGPRDPENPTGPAVESIDAAIESADEIIGEVATTRSKTIRCESNGTGNENPPRSWTWRSSPLSTPTRP